MKCITNMHKRLRPVVEQVAAETGLKLIWRDEPEESFVFQNGKWGSVWCDESADLHLFWTEFTRLKSAKPET